MALNDTLNLNDRGSQLVPPFEDPGVHSMQPLKGFLAVTAACSTSGLAGVYFEMVLKGSKADLWIRNSPYNSAGWFWDLFHDLGMGHGLCASVRRTCDGVVTSLSIIISFLNNAR
ncbi:hypothetical protein JB92DRAFT_3106826 [Gautieria morchelliformis]|nr:hypothetical protein JB92DRAFT_3106826 [Gautieria morchelliformis]